jgi:hypothetical protein
MQLHRSSYQQLPWPVETEYLKFPKNVGGRAWNLPNPIGRSKTPPRPLREVFRIRMGKSGWESGYLFGQPLDICQSDGVVVHGGLFQIRFLKRGRV